MNKKRILPLIILTSVGLTACASMSPNSTSAKKNMQENAMSHEMGKGDMQNEMDEMDMSNIELTGVPEVDFFASMVPHHRGAIEMSETLYNSISDPSLKKLADSIISSQEAEITFMKNYLATHPVSPDAKTDMALSEQMLSESMKFMDIMEAAKTTGNGNKDFINAMMPHHAAAVKMAQVVLPYLSDPEVKQFAKDVIKVQNQEIVQMNQWLQKNK